LPLAVLAASCTRSGRDDVGRAEVTSIVIAVDASGRTSSAVDAEDDAALARDLRGALEADDTLSPRARAIEVLARGGVVTLRGRVTSPREHDDVIAKAKRAGAVAVDDQLSVSATRTRASPGARGP
jgi:osmotically-inducible protein OsmY